MRSIPLFKLVISIAIALTSVAAAGATLSDAAGKTVLFFDEAHGNQVEYYDQDGLCFLWYPGNAKVVPGRWVIEGEDICFKYGKNTYNAVTRTPGGEWDCSPVNAWTKRIVDTVSGDAFSLSVSGPPYRLPAKPKFESIAQMKNQAR